MTKDEESRAIWPGEAAMEAAAAFLDLWERQVSERARRGPGTGAPPEPVCATDAA